MSGTNATQDVEAGIDTSINVTVAPKYQDSQDREIRPTSPALSSEQRCGMVIRDMYLSLESFRTKLGSKVPSCSKSDSPILMDWLRSHSGPNVKALLAQSLHKVLIGLFDIQKGRRKQGKTSLRSNPTGGLVTVMPVPQK